MENYTTKYPRESIEFPEMIKYSLCCITVIGVLGNVVALIVLRGSESIRSSNSGLLLVNQSACDLFTCLVIALELATSRTYTDIGWYGQSGKLMCIFIVSEVFMYGSLVVSSYNLVALAGERTLAVVWPIPHRKFIGRRFVLCTCIFVWIFGFGTQFAFLLPSTRVIGQLGHCVDWDVFPNQRKRKVFGIAMLFQMYIVPVVFLLTSAALINRALKLRFKEESGVGKDNNRVRKNVLKTLTSVILCYMICMTPKAFVHLLYTTGIKKISMSGNTYRSTVVFMFTNVAINPIVYTFQYREYQKELRRLFHCKPPKVEQESTCS